MALQLPGDWMNISRKLAMKLPVYDTLKYQMNILLCGPPGHGKSSTGNSILGSTEFAVSDDGVTETASVKLHSTMYGHYKVRIFDCPPAPREKPNSVKVSQVCRLIMPTVRKICPVGFDVAIIVLKYGSRFYEEEEFVMAMLKEMFGEKFIEDHCICVVSNGDMFKKVTEKSRSQRLPEEFNNWCRKQNQTSVLGRMFKACKYRCVLFDNFTSDMSIKNQQVNQLMSMILDTWPKTYSVVMVSINPNMRVKADIHILIETASSIDEYRSQLNFVVNYTSSYKMSPETAKVCVMIFGQDEHLRFDFSQLNNHEQLEKTLLRAPFLKPSSGTDKALMTARQESFSSSGGMRHGVKQLLLMLTEGRSANEGKAVEEADELKRSGTEIIVVGVASVNRDTLMAIASEPETVYIADDYEELEKLPTEVAHKTVEKAPEFKSTADILFILDSSGSISPEDYQKELDFVVHLTECFNIGPDNVHFSVIVFSSDAEILFDFTLTTHDEVKKAINTATHMQQSTNTAEALNLARTDAFTNRRGSRAGKKIAVVITDGCSNDFHQTAEAAQLLFDSGVLILAVGVGDINETELKYIATLPEDVYTVDDYSVIETIKDELANKTSKLETAQRVQRRPLPDLNHLINSDPFQRFANVAISGLRAQQDHQDPSCIIS